MRPDPREGRTDLFDFSRARLAQERLRRLISLRPLKAVPRHIVGVDASYWRAGSTSYGVGVSVSLGYPSLEPEACWALAVRVLVPYVPGYLAFREMELISWPLMTLLGSLSGSVVIIADGHGLAHPRGFGLASHIGVVFSRPSIGVAKGLLYGKLGQCELGTCIFVEGQAVGFIAVNSQGRRLYVSLGNMITLPDAWRLMQGLMKPGLALPAPTALADVLTKVIRDQAKRGLIPMGAPVNCGPLAYKTGISLLQLSRP